MACTKQDARLVGLHRPAVVVFRCHMNDTSLQAIQKLYEVEMPCRETICGTK